MERLWAYLRPLSAITKEMTQSHRVDLLSDALRHYKCRKMRQLGELLTCMFDLLSVIMCEDIIDEIM
jgi:hypothetical protein